MSALADAIAGEEAAVYAYGLAGARLSGAARDRALGGLAAHRARVLQLRERAGSVPGAAGGYDVAAPADEDEARGLLADVESRLAATYADLAAATSGDERPKGKKIVSVYFSAGSTQSKPITVKLK